MPRKKKPPEEREGRFQSLITGKFVSAYYAKRHPKTTRKVEVNEAYRGSGESSEDTAPRGGSGVRPKNPDAKKFAEAKRISGLLTERELVQAKSPTTGKWQMIDPEAWEVVEEQDEQYPILPVKEVRTIKSSPTAEERRYTSKRYVPKTGTRVPRTGFLRGNDPTLAANFEEEMANPPRRNRGSELAREIKAKMRPPLDYADSSDLIHWDRVGVTPEQAAEWVMGNHPDEDAAEFAERFLKRCEELRAED